MALSIGSGLMETDMKKLTEAQKKQLKGRVLKVTPENEEDVRRKYSQAEIKAEQRGAARELLEGVRTMWRMLVDSSYTISWDVKAWIIFGLAYFISPFDIIPDFLPGVGYLDDALVVAWVLHQISDEVTKYRRKRS